MDKVSGTFKLVFGFIVGFFFLFSATGFASENDGAGWVYKTMDLEVTYLPETKKILVEGRAILKLEDEISFGPTLALNLNGTLGLRQEIMNFTKVSAGQEAEVVINVSPNDDSHEHANATKLANIRFQDAFQNGEEIEVRFSFESVGEAFQFKISEANSVASYEAGWYPLPISGPNQTENRLKRTIGITKFNLPAGVHSFSNGKLIEQSEDENRVVEVWQITTPLARSFALGPYQYERFNINGSEIAVYLLPDSNRPDWTRGKVIPVSEMLEGLSRSIEILEVAYGPFPFESFGVVEVPNSLVNWWGSLEEGFMIGTSGSLSNNKINILETISHEVAHVWWGAWVEAEGPGAYLGNEALANFSARYFFEKYFGAELSNHLFRYGTFGTPPIFNYSAKGYFQQFRDGKDAPLSGLVSGSGNNYNLASAKGGLMYDMLRRRIGDDEVFFGVFKALVKKFGRKTLSLADIREGFVLAAPEEAKLERFFAQWLDGTGAPRLEATWTEVNDNQVEITITQTHGGTPFNLFLDVDVYFDGKATRQTIEVDGLVTRIAMEKTGKVDDVVLDPDHVLLIWNPDYGPFPEG